MQHDYRHFQGDAEPEAVLTGAAAKASCERAALSPWRARLLDLVESRWAERILTAAILINAVVLGMETSPSIMQAIGPILIFIDHTVLGLFVAELGIKIFALRWRYFRSGWNVFDLLVVGIALVPASGPFAILRALRVLRLLRLFSMVPRLRRVVQALLDSLPGMGGVVAVLGLVFYVSSVLATGLFRSSFPQWFGGIGSSMYSLFQIMTLESWSMGIVRPVMEVYPYAWAFFVPFIILTSFTALNLFIAVLVSAMQHSHVEPEQGPDAQTPVTTSASGALITSPHAQGLLGQDPTQQTQAVISQDGVQEEMRALRQEMTALRAAIQHSLINGNTSEGVSRGIENETGSAAGENPATPSVTL